MTGGGLIREARLRAGLSQGELGDRVGRGRAVIARWERDAVTPSFDAVVEIVEACGFDLVLDARQESPVDDAAIREWLELSPQERVERAIRERRDE